MDLLEALVMVKDKNGKKIGEHDMVMEIVTALPHSSGALRGYLSVELKVRHLWSAQGRRDVRKKMRSEMVDDCKWWQQEKEKFAGRLICMACFTDKNSSVFELYGDLKLNSEKWQPLFGWVADDARVGTPVAKRSASSAGLKIKSEKQVSTQSRPQSSDALDTVISNLAWMEQDGMEELVAEGGEFLCAINKNSVHSSYYAKQAQTRHHWSDTCELFQIPRPSKASKGQKRRKVGGSPMWVAVEAVLRQMYFDIPNPI